MSESFEVWRINNNWAVINLKRLKMKVKMIENIQTFRLILQFT